MLIAGRAENLKALASGAWQLRVSSRCGRPSSIDEDHSGRDKDRREGFLDKIACRQILLAKPEATIDRIAPNRNTNSEVGRVTIAPNETAPTTTHTERLEARGDNRGFLSLERRKSRYNAHPHTARRMRRPHSRQRRRSQPRWDATPGAQTSRAVRTWLQIS
jgi:hypothetical protein